LTFNLFPSSGFDQAVTTPVLIGLLLSWFFTETLGWVFAGLVVPGYLAAVMLLNPTSALLDVSEAVVTYGIARILGEHLSRTGGFSRFFGRERFLLVVVISVLVRLGIEGLLLPVLKIRSSWAFSIGLVVVPLLANSCWKTGLGRGLVQNGVPAFLTYVILRYIFARYTNFSLRGFELATENVAADFLSSPKIYLLLLTGAIIGAAANVRYGWDYNGILVPALLGLVIVQPSRLLVTFVEAAVLLVLIASLQKWTPVGRWNIEGPRRVVVFFCTDYLLRFGLAWVFSKSLPTVDVNGFLGFGYLLPTLLAVKSSQKGALALVILPSAVIAAASFLFGTLLGFFVSQTGGKPEATQKAAPANPWFAQKDPASAARVMASLARTTAPRSLARASEITDAILEFLSHPQDPSALAPAGYALDALDGGFLVAHERIADLDSRQGLPAFILAPNATVTRVALVLGPHGSGQRAASAGKALQDGLYRIVVISEDETHAELASRVADRLAERLKGAVQTVTDDGRQANHTKGQEPLPALPIACNTHRRSAHIYWGNKQRGSARARSHGTHTTFGSQA
jgi:Capsule biosynthesis CapC